MAKRKKLQEGTGWSLERTCPRCGNIESRCRCSPRDDVRRRGEPDGAASVVRMRLEKRRGKPVTVLEADVADERFRETVEGLRGKLGTGGTVKGSLGELRGDHRERAREALAAAGFEVRG